MKVIENILQSLQSAAKFNSNAQVAPACILWPDADRQWEAVIPRLQEELPELLVLGNYTPDKKTGPAIWLRCVLAGKIEEISFTKNSIPIIYLPGVGRSDLRAVDNCSDYLKPLAELQYRGIIWSQVNAKDWTILAYLKSDQGGLKLDVAQDNETKNAMQLALSVLLDEEIELLKGKRLDKDYFNSLLTGGDTIKDVLQWLDQGDAFQSKRGQNEWKAFCEICKSQIGFNPQSEGILAGSGKFAMHEGPWKAVWDRFCESPKRYPNIPANIKKCSPPSDTIFWQMGGKNCEGWPQWNDGQEKKLLADLLALENLTAVDSRKKLAELEKLHGERREFVWTELGQSPLVSALLHLSFLAELTKNNLASGKIVDLLNGYCSFGWKADDAVLKALEYADNDQNLKAITVAIRAVYLPWIEESARYLQKVVSETGYPGEIAQNSKPFIQTDDECILFVDGLRYDTAKRLIQSLSDESIDVQQEIKWAALPSVTATGKAAVTPVKNNITGLQDNDDFEPVVKDTEQPLKGGYHLKKLLNNSGWSVLEQQENGYGKGNSWCEFGNLDHEGHDRGWKMAKQIDVLLNDIKNRVLSLFNAGWKTIRIVSDHGWLLVPGGLPKTDLPAALTENKWGRCASIKTGASVKAELFPWYWNKNIHFALAEGVSCYKKGEEYAHGGLSLQECLLLELKIFSPQMILTLSAEITDIKWTGLRCKVAVSGIFEGARLDLRLNAGEPQTSVVLEIKPINEKGIASIVVEDDNLEGKEAVLVLIDSTESLIAQQATIIGGGK